MQRRWRSGDVPPTAAAIAAHRFGLGEASLEAVGPDPAAWLTRQIGPAEAPRGAGLLSSAQAIGLVHLESRIRVQAEKAPPGSADLDRVRQLKLQREAANTADVQSHMLSALQAGRPFAERLVGFWANHFTVSVKRNAARGTVGSFERDAIRPHIAGRFEDLLFASTTHPAMLRYLDNIESAGPRSAAVNQDGALKAGEARRPRGLNENLAREVLELHTLGVTAGADAARSLYTQADVRAFANVLTGWRTGPFDDHAGLEPAWHEPGPKTVLGRVYPEGAEGLRRSLADLARHPATVRFLATKLARHFVADQPPAALVERLAAAWRRADGDLASVYRTLIASPEAWAPQSLKLKTPEEVVISSARLLGLGRMAQPDDALAGLLVDGATALGQPPMGPASPQGWLDRADEWLGPDAMWKRVEWATHLGQRYGTQVDARALAEASLGARLSDPTRGQLQRAADGGQALALLLMSPEFQRR